MLPSVYRRSDPTLIQEERSHMYTGRAVPHLYRKMSNPTCIQRERSDMYTGIEIRHLYREMFNPTSIQKERSLPYTEKRSHTYTEGCLTPYVYRDDFSYLKSFVKEKTIKHVDWKPRKRNG